MSNIKLYVGFHEHILHELNVAFGNELDRFMIRVPTESYGRHLKREIERICEFKVSNLSEEMDPVQALRVSKIVLGNQSAPGFNVLIWHWGFSKYVDYEKILREKEHFNEIIVVCDVCSIQFHEQLIVDMKEELNAELLVFNRMFIPSRTVSFELLPPIEIKVDPLDKWITFCLQLCPRLKLTDLEMQLVQPFHPQFMTYLQDLAVEAQISMDFQTEFLLRTLISVVRYLKVQDFFPKKFALTVFKNEMQEILKNLPHAINRDDFTCPSWVKLPMPIEFKDLKLRVTQEYQTFLAQEEEDVKPVPLISGILIESIKTNDEDRLSGICFRDMVDVEELIPEFEKKLPTSLVCSLPTFKPVAYFDHKKPVVLLGTYSQFRRVINGHKVFDTLYRCDQNILEANSFRFDHLSECSANQIFFYADLSMDEIEGDYQPFLQNLLSIGQKARISGSRKRKREKDTYFETFEPLPKKPSLKVEKVVASEPEDKPVFPLRYPDEHFANLAKELSMSVVVYCNHYCQEHFKQSPKTDIKQLFFDQNTNVHTFEATMTVSVKGRLVRSMGMGTSKKNSRLHASLNLLKTFLYERVIVDPKLKEKIFTQEELGNLYFPS